MGGALAVYLPLYRLIVRGKPLFAPAHALPTKNAIDVPLLANAALFGVGWGLGGFCPGPALAGLVSGTSGVYFFVIAMLAGQWLAGRLTGAQ